MSEIKRDIDFVELARSCGDEEICLFIDSVIEHGEKASPELVLKLKKLKAEAAVELFPNGWGNPASPWTGL